jgi:hypothetical protein
MTGTDPVAVPARTGSGDEDHRPAGQARQGTAGVGAGGRGSGSPDGQRRRAGRRQVSLAWPLRPGTGARRVPAGNSVLVRGGAAGVIRDA